MCHSDPLDPGGLRSTLDVSAYSVTAGDHGWEERAVSIFFQSGFVIVHKALENSACEAVLDACKNAEAQIVKPSRKGNRGLGRYSLGNASHSRAMLHCPAFTEHLLDCATLHGLLSLIFEDGAEPGLDV